MMDKLIEDDPEACKRTWGFIRGTLETSLNFSDLSKYREPIKKYIYEKTKISDATEVSFS